MQSYRNLIAPFKRRLNEIKESLQPQQLLNAGDEKMVYGTLEKTFENFSKQYLRNGNRVNEVDYYTDIIKELQEIEEAILQIEKKINSEEKNSIQFHGIFNIIHSTKQTAKKQIDYLVNLSNPKKNIPKVRNVKKKMSYKWLLEESKLYDFKRLLIKNELIDPLIDFQDFKGIFSENYIVEIKRPIVWKNENATQLIYLIIVLENKGILDKRGKNSDFIKLCQCFVKNKDLNFTENFKSLKTNIEDKIDTDFKALVENIVTQLLK